MHFWDKLYEEIEKKSPICVGIDPRLNQIPEFIKNAAIEEAWNNVDWVALAFTNFSMAIIDSVADLVPAIKPQLAFFEMYGSAGILAYEEICEYAKEKWLLIIADWKRNDIWSTAEAYAKAFLWEVPLFEWTTSVSSADALTVNPYLGSDGIKPFQTQCDENGKGIFCLVKTSNPSWWEIQDLTVNEEMVHEEVARLVSSWGMSSLWKNSYSNVWCVVGATYPEEAKYLRSLMPNQFFLVPWYGAQWGGAADAKPCFNADGTGAIVNSSRWIIFAYQKDAKYWEENFEDAARDATMAMKLDLESIRN